MTITDIQPIAGVPAALLVAINSRLRELANATTPSTTTTTSGGGASTGATPELMILVTY